MAAVKAAECRQMEFGFLCICSDRCTTIPDRDIKKYISISWICDFLAHFFFFISSFLKCPELFSWILKYSLFEHIVKYIQLLRTLCFASRWIAAVSKAPFLPFLHLLKMGDVRLRTWTTDLLSKEGASKDIQFSEICCSLLVVPDSALNTWLYANTLRSCVPIGHPFRLYCWVCTCSSNVYLSGFLVFILS